METGIRHPEDFAFEAAYQAQEANGTRYYLAGKGVCITETGRALWFDMPEDDVGCFTFDAPVLNRHLHSRFTPEEERTLETIRMLDYQADELLLHVVTTQQDGEHQAAVFYCPMSDAYFRVGLDEVDRVDLITSALMAQVPEPRGLDDPYDIRVDDDGVIY